MELHKLITERWSPRAYNDRSVNENTLTTLFEAASWAASCFNEQPWRFIYATKENEKQYQKLFDCLAEGNQTWVKNAPVIILTIAKKTFTRNEKPNKHSWHDVGLAMGNFSAQATAMGLHLHQMAGFDAEKAEKDLNIPKDYEAVAMVALGYKGNPETLPEKLRDMEVAERKRKPLEEIVFKGKWND